MNSEWYYSKGNKQCGPVGFETLQHLLRIGELQETTTVWRSEQGLHLPLAKAMGEVAPPPPLLGLPTNGGHSGVTN